MPRFRNRSRPVIVHLNHGLGNQLSLYFAGLAYALRFNRQLIAVVKGDNAHGHDSFRDINNLILPGKFVTETKSGSRFLNRLRQFIAFRIPQSFRLTKKYYSTTLGYDDELFKLPEIREIHGFFHTYFYYEACLSEFKNLSADKIFHLSSFSKEIMAKMKSEKSTVVHIRRGDYLHHNLTFGLLEEKYYLDSITTLDALSGTGKIYVFSDDITAAKLLMEKIGQNDATFPEEIYPLAACEVLYLMRSADNLVMANSTLSYWAAIFSNEESNVIAPRPFYRSQALSGNNFYKPNWIILNSNFS